MGIIFLGIEPKKPSEKVYETSSIKNPFVDEIESNSISLKKEKLKSILLLLVLVLSLAKRIENDNIKNNQM